MNAEAIYFAENSTTVRTNFAARTIGAGIRLLDLVAPSRAIRLAASLFLTPRRIERPDREIRWMEDAVRETRLTGRSRLSLLSWGSGPVVLLVHGWEGRGSQLGAFASPLVAAGYRVVAVDLPAHGDSPGRRTNLIECGAAVRSLISELDPAAVIAHSFGSAATTLALSQLPPRYSPRLVYLSPPEDFDFFTASFARILGIPFDLATRMQQEIERSFEIDWSKMRGRVVAPAMSAPLLVIHDEDDDEVPSHYGRTLAGAWPEAKLMITKGLGHRRILRDERVIDETVKFLVQ